MKKRLFIYPVFVLLISLSGLTASNSASRTTQHALSGIRLINQNSEVTYFFRYGTGIGVAQCIQYTGLNAIADCKLKSGTSFVAIDVKEFRNRLRILLKYSGDVVIDSIEKKINSYREVGGLDTEKIEELKSLQKFIQRQGVQNVDVALVNRFQTLKETSEVEKLVNKIIYDITKKSGLNEYIFATDKKQLIFNLLHAYTKNPGFFQEFVTVPPGNYKNIKVDKEFSIQFAPVSQFQYTMVMNDNPTPGNLNCPADKIYIGYMIVCPNFSVIEREKQKLEYIEKLNASNPVYSYRLGLAPV